MFCLTNPVKLTWLKTFHPPSSRISSDLQWNTSTTLGGVARFVYWVLPMFQQLIIHLIEWICSIIAVDDMVPPPLVFKSKSLNSYPSSLFLWVFYQLFLSYLSVTWFSCETWSKIADLCTSSSDSFLAARVNFLPKSFLTLL